MSSWYLIWQTFEEVAWQKVKPNEDLDLDSSRRENKQYSLENEKPRL